MYTKKAYEFSTSELIAIKAALEITMKRLSDIVALPVFEDWGPHINEAGANNLERITKLYNKVDLALKEEKLAIENYKSKL